MKEVSALAIFNNHKRLLGGSFDGVGGKHKRVIHNLQRSNLVLEQRFHDGCVDLGPIDDFKNNWDPAGGVNA